MFGKLKDEDVQLAIEWLRDYDEEAEEYPRVIAVADHLESELDKRSKRREVDRVVATLRKELPGVPIAVIRERVKEEMG